MKDRHFLRLIQSYSIFPVFSTDEKYIVMQLVFLHANMGREEHDNFRRRLLKTWHITSSRKNTAGKPKTRRPKKSKEPVAENQSETAVVLLAEEAHQESHSVSGNHTVPACPEVQDDRAEREVAKTTPDGQYQADSGAVVQQNQPANFVAAEKHQATSAEIARNEGINSGTDANRGTSTVSSGVVPESPLQTSPQASSFEEVGTSHRNAFRR